MIDMRILFHAQHALWRNRLNVALWSFKKKNVDPPRLMDWLGTHFLSHFYVIFKKEPSLF